MAGAFARIQKPMEGYIMRWTYEQAPCNKPCAAPGLKSYRYAGRYGYIMIGATDDHDALVQANRSLTDGGALFENLQRWNGAQYVRVMP